MNNTPASQQRFEACKREDAYNRLAYCPELRAETIARHYISLFNTARDLHELCRLRQYGSDSDTTDQAIAYLTKQIMDSHDHAFGIPLEWPRDRTTA